MLSEHERRTLACIERRLVRSDPDLARLFSAAAGHRSDGPASTFLLVAGLTMLVIGSIAVAVPVTVAGAALSIVALLAAHVRAMGPGRTSLS